MALGPDGVCVLCRRSLGPPLAAAGQRRLVLPIAAVLVAVGGGIGFTHLRDRAPHPSTAADASPGAQALHVVPSARDPRGLVAEQRLRGATEVEPDYSSRELESAKSRGLYVITGSLDMNLGQISDIHPALLEDGFSSVHVVSLEGMGHQKPPADAFAQGLDWLASH